MDIWYLIMEIVLLLGPNGWTPEYEGYLIVVIAKLIWFIIYSEILMED